jgi:sugar lactone lactonase YvrE
MATLETSTLFPADRSLNRAEDGVALPDGRLIVSDHIDGLRVIAPDGSTAPFGNMRAAGYLHDPPQRQAAANGVSMEPGGSHILVADVFGGSIYRVAITDGAAERVYQHRFGVNTAVRDSTGAIWFTQSTECTAETGEARLFAAVDVPMTDGSLWRLDFRDGKFAASATVVAEGLSFPNGLALDERARMIYVAETCGDRILKAPLDVAAGRIGQPTVLATLPTPDNLELDCRGRLWVASPILNEVGVVDTRSGAYRPVFRQQSAAQVERAGEFSRRGHASVPRVVLFVPDQWEPLPGPVTGVILGPGEGDWHISGLANTLIRLPR